MKFNPVIVDLSHYDDVTNWGEVAQFPIWGVINKATEGPGMVDKTYAIRRPHCVERDILYGGYHFMRPGDPIRQANHYLDVVKDDGKIVLALDHEDPAVPLDNAKAFLKHILDVTGRRALLYSGFLIKQQLGSRTDPFLAGHRLWLSHYNTKPKWPKNWQNPWLIQFTGDGKGPVPHNVPGIIIDGKGIDINHYGGTREQLTLEWSGEVLTS